MNVERSLTVGLVSPWPQVKNAEYEIIERIKIALARMGHRHLIIDADGVVIEGGSQEDLDRADFCISMHFISPKLWRPFTYLAMWNPPRYYHDADYERVMSHLGSYDDYLLYESAPIRNHLLNYLRLSGRSIEGALAFYSGGAGQSHPPVTLPARPALFYCGINWERLSGTHGRHHELLQLLDQAGLTRIYGPEKFEGIRPWAGFQTFQGSIPFDGSSLFLKLRECGVALVLSSYDHIKSEAASNRIYEACAAGVVILSDRNPFIVKEFGDRVRYFDYGSTWEETFGNIRREFDWIRENPEKAAELARRSQEHYLKKYTLEIGLETLISHHRSRSATVAAQLDGGGSSADVVTLLSSDFSDAQLDGMVDQLARQDHRNYRWLAVGDAATLERLRGRLESSPELATRFAPCLVETLIPGFRLPRLTEGGFWLKALEQARGDWLTALQPGQTWHARHLSVLGGAFERDPRCGTVHSGSYMRRKGKAQRYLKSFGLPLPHIARIIRLEASLKDIPVAVRRSALKIDDSMASLMNLLEDNTMLFFWVTASSFGPTRFTQHLSVMFEETEDTPNRDRISMNLMRDYFRNDPAYRAAIKEYPLMYTGDLSFHTLRRVILDFFRPKVERTRFMPFVRWFYRRFITRVIY